MPKTKLMDDDNTNYVPPNLFLAAQTDDIYQMSLALQQGQVLSAQRERDLMTPVHIAAIYGSEKFICRAMEVAPQTAWILDSYGYRPIEHASARSDRKSMAYLGNAMFPEMPVPVPPEQ